MISTGNDVMIEDLVYHEVIRGSFVFRFFFLCSFFCACVHYRYRLLDLSSDYVPFMMLDRRRFHLYHLLHRILRRYLFSLYHPSLDIRGPHPEHS